MGTFFPYKKPGSIDTRRLKTSIEIQIKNILLPELDKKHYTRAHSTEECIMLLANSFNSQLFTDIAPVPQYLQWLIAADRLYTYQEYGDQLKILQSFHPGKRFVLKAPNHFGNLKELLTCIPDAIVIQMHRSPEECSSSRISLSKSKYKMVINEINIREIQNLTFHLFDSELKKNLEFHRLQKDRIISLSHNAFISDPLTTLHEIYEKASLNWTQEIEELSKKFVHLNPKSRRGIHKYRHSINREEIPASFTNYKSYFSHYL